MKWFSVEKGYGFIERDSGGDLFAHRTALADPDVRKLEAGQRVRFQVERSQKGPKAAQIALLDAGRASAGSKQPRSPSKGSPRAATRAELPTLNEQLERELGERLLRRRSIT